MKEEFIGLNAHTIVIDDLTSNNQEEIITDKELQRYKVKLKIKKTMKVYNDMLDISTTDIVDEMIGNKGLKMVTTKNNVRSNKLEDGVINKLNADTFVGIIDDIVYKELYGIYREIIHNRYMEELTVGETYNSVRNDFLKIPRKSNRYGIATFYRDKWKSEVAFYKKIIKNLKNF